MNYIVYFTSGLNLAISNKDFIALTQNAEQIGIILSNDIAIFPRNIAYIAPVEDEGKSKVITSPSPLQVKHDKDIEEQRSTPTTLDEQLESDKLGE